MTNQNKLTERIYNKLVGSDGEVVAKGISEEAVPAIPGNFLRILLATILTKTGDGLSKPGVILTWLLGTLGAPSSLIGLIVPVREAGSLVLQLFVGEYVGRHKIRKHFWVAGCVLQGLAILGMVPVALTLKGAAAGWAVVGLLAIFSLSRGVCSIVSKDLVGRTIPKTRRGRLGGISTSVAGVVAVGVGIWLLIYKGEDLKPVVFAVILGCAGTLWLIGAVVMSRLNEKPASASEKGNPLSAVLESFKLLKNDRDFRLFCVARALLAGTILSMPFYVILARDATSGNSGGLGLLLIAGSIATAVSGVFWGKFADFSSRKTLAVAGISAGAIGFLTAGISGVAMTPLIASLVYGTLFFLIGLAHTGIRLGRKTHLIDMSTAENRATMVAVSNTLIGVVLLLSSSFGLLADLVGERIVILIFALLGLAGGLLALRLPDVQQD